MILRRHVRAGVHPHVGRSRGSSEKEEKKKKIFLRNFCGILSEFHGYSQKMMNCLEILIKRARKMREKAENSGIGAKFHSFISLSIVSLKRTLSCCGRGGKPTEARPFRAWVYRSLCSCLKGLERPSTSLFPWLVLGCINTDISNQPPIFQHFSRSTKWSSLILQNFAKF